MRSRDPSRWRRFPLLLLRSAALPLLRLFLFFARAVRRQFQLVEVK